MILLVLLVSLAGGSMLAAAANLVPYVPVQAGFRSAQDIAASGKDINVAPYAEGRVLLKLSSQAIEGSVIPRGYGPTSAVIGSYIGVQHVDEVLNSIGAESVQRSFIEPANQVMAKSLGLDRWFTVEYAGDVDPAAVKDLFATVLEVEEVTPDYRAFLAVVPPDPMHPLHWGHNNTAQMLSYDWATFSHENGSPVGTVGFDANAHSAWNGPAGFGSSSVIIAIVDTGVATGHPDIPQMAGYDFGDNDSNPNDDSADPGHGTACSGVAAARTNNLGTAGIAAGCTIMPLKVADSAGSLYFSYIQNALIYAADNGADVVSMSLGASITSDPATDAAIDYAWNAGVVILAATGNANASQISYPAYHPNVIGIGAASPCGDRKRSSSNTSELNPGVNPDPNGYTCDGERWWGSNYCTVAQDHQGAVDVIAPTILPTTDLPGAAGYDPSDYSKWFNGTSCATPYAAGVCGLIKSANPTWTNTQIRYQLLHTAQDIVNIESGAGWDQYTGYGMVDAYAAAASGPYPNPPTNITATSDCLAPSQIVLNWTDPTIHGDGTPLGDFEILVSRDGTPIGPVDQGIQTLTDTGLTPGQLYQYTLRTHDQDTDSLSLAITISKYAGGDPTPAPPAGFSVTAVAGPAFQLDWTNPATNADGSTLCDFAGINVYRNGAFLAAVPLGPGLIGLPGTFTDTAPVPGLNCYKLTAIDSELPVHESGYTTEICVEVPLNLPFGDCFEIAGAPDTGKWTTGGVEVDNLGANVPTPPYSADFDATDELVSRAIDLSGASGLGYVLLYQKEQTGNGESADANNDLIIEFMNSDGNWDEVARHLGSGPDETSFTTEIVNLDAAVPSSGTFFHSQFHVRFRVTGDSGAGYDNWFVDCVNIDIPSCQPTASVAPASISDNLVAGTINGSVQAVTVSNSCLYNALAWSAAANPPVTWLTLTGASGTISGIGSQAISAAFNAIGMSPGTYNTNIEVTSNDPVNPLLVVTATLVVEAAPVISVAPTSIYNSLANTDPPAVDNVTISNPGGGTLYFNVIDDASAVHAFQPSIVSVKRADGTVMPMGDQPAPVASDAKQAWYRGARNAGFGRIDAGFDPNEVIAGGDRKRSANVFKDVGDRGQDRHYPPQPYASGGPDAAGYRWIDSDDANGPDYNWVEISGVGTPITLTDDSNAGPFGLGFPFNHYGNTYSSLRVCSNGWVSFTSSATTLTNTALPSASAPLDMLAPFWDDMNPGAGGTVYYYQDVANNRFIVEYKDVPYYSTSGSTNSFEVIINKDGTILFQYADVDAPGNTMTVGIQNGTGTIGLQMAFNQLYLHNGLAVLLYQDAAWLSAAPGSGTVPPGGSAILAVTSDPTGLLPGTYLGNVIITSNDPVTPQTAVHVQMDVTGTGVALPFCDQFNTGSVPDPANWPIVSGVTLDGVGVNEPSLPTSARFRGGNSMTSNIINTSTASGTGQKLFYYVENGGGGDATETGDDLIVEFKNSTGVWDEVQRNLGGGAIGNVYTLKVVALDALTPSAGTYFFPTFQVRIRNLGTPATDDWFVDDLCITTPPCLPTIALGATTICDTLVAGTTGVPKPLVISNTCAFDVLTWSLVESPDQTWLTVSPLSGSVSGVGSSSVDFTFDATGMLPGNYTTTVFVTSNDPANPSIPVAVCFKVTGAPSFTTSPDSLCPVVGYVNGPLVHVPLTINNPGVAPLNWRLWDTQGIPAAPGTIRALSARTPQPNPAKLAMFGDLANLPVPEEDPNADPEAKGYESPYRGGLQPYAQGGPDAFGYTWIDSDQAGGPSFDWVEIEGVGGVDTGIACDDCNVGPFNLGFSFPFYGTNYSSIRVCSNGWLSFTSTLTTFTNQCNLSATTPNALIAPFWDDLDLRTRGKVYYRSDAAMGRFIVEYKKVAKFGAAAGDTFTFQTVLCRDGSIQHNYLGMKGTRNSATIGIKDATGATRLQVSCNTNYVHDNMTILIQNDQEWLSAVPTSGSVPPGGSQVIDVVFDPTGLVLNSTHRGWLRFKTNDPAQARCAIPVCFEIHDTPIAVALSRFEAVSTPDGVTLEWATASEDNHSHFDVYRADGTSGVFNQVNTAPVTGNGTYQFVDAGLADGSYSYRLEAVDRNGGRQFFGPITVQHAGRPTAFALAQNYPNPFVGRTLFRVDLPTAVPVTLRVFDATGRLVRTFADGAMMDAGRHTYEWDGRDDGGHPAAAGFYFLRAEAPSYSQTIRMLMAR